MHSLEPGLETQTEFWDLGCTPGKGQEEGIEPGKKGHPQGTSLDKALSPHQAPGPLPSPQLGNCQFCSLPCLSSFSGETRPWSTGYQANLRAHCLPLVEQGFQLRSLWFPSSCSIRFFPIKWAQRAFLTEDALYWKLCLSVFCIISTLLRSSVTSKAH